MVGLPRLTMKHSRAPHTFANVFALLALSLTTSHAQALTTSTSASAPKQAVTAKANEPAKPKAKAKTAVESKPEVLFEGYSKILMGDKHVGYTIQRFEFDAGKKEYSTVYYLKTAPPASEIIESLKARSTFDLKPLSYNYTELAGGKPHTIDASFASGVMSITELKDGRRITRQPVKVPPGTFLASFLGYLMLQQKDAVKVGNKYSYQAIAEEDGNAYKGEAYVKSEEKTKDLRTFKILNTYKGLQYVSYMTPQGEVIATDSAAQGIATELVSNIADATKGLSVNSNQLAQLFGSVPKGQDNALSRHSAGAPLGAEKSHETPDGAIPLEPVNESPKPSKSPATKPAGE